MPTDDTDFGSTLAEAAPYPLIVLSPSGQVLYRNQAAVELRREVAAKRGQAVMDGITEEASNYVRTGTEFPATRLVRRRHEGEHVAGEILFCRFGDHFLATWSDVTEREDGRRFLDRLGEELTGAAHTLAKLGSGLNDDVHQLSERADAVASGVTEMSASIGEISRSASEAATGSSQALAAAKRISVRVEELSGASSKIGSVSKLISSIAGQTKLLALNATIEAARAGQAGRGFAVVANEVKELAAATALATQDIDPMIEAIRASSGAVREAVQEILSVVEAVEGQQTTIASAVEEQGIAASEMSAGVNGVASSVQSTASAVEQLMQVAEEVAGRAEEVSARL